MTENNRIKYLRVSLLNRCNLNCFYCKPPCSETKPEKLPDHFDKFRESIELLTNMGIRKIRFTGGEPTLYKKLLDLIRFTKGLNPDIFTGVTSNGILLERQAKTLAKAGLDSINISLDTIDKHKFRTITAVDKLEQVLAGIHQAIEHITIVKLNCILIKGVNDDETEQMISMANDLGISIRFIEYMPTKNNSDSMRKYISGDDVRDGLPYHFNLIDTEPEAAAKYYSSPDLDILVGFINPVSHSFCADCTRLRLASDGSLYGCLFSSQSINIFELIENNHNKIVEEIQKLVTAKQYLGCCGGMLTEDNLPSFLNMGG